MDKKNQGWATS